MAHWRESRGKRRGRWTFRREVLHLFGRVGQGDEERPNKVLVLPVKRIPVDKQNLERCQPGEPRRERSETIVANGEGVQSRQMRQRAREGC